MFGSKKNKIQEQIKKAFAPIQEGRKEFEERVTSIEESEKQIYQDVCQVMENTNHLADYAMQNIEEESTLIYKIDDLSKDLKTVADEYSQIIEMVKENYEGVTNLVEENKHYTTPSKYLTEAPAKIRQEYQSYEDKVEEMAESARQMSVMAVNAAIEAGRMGVTGKPFVAVSEEIRQTALGYESTLLTMKEDIQEAKERINELEEVVLRLVSLIKDGNVGTTRLMKKSMELNKMAAESSMRDFSEDVMIIRDKVVAMRNLDEEIAKSSERNKIQLCDIQEEILTQKKVLREAESDLSYMFDEAQEKMY